VCRARLSWRSPQRLRRWRTVRPLAGIGAAPASMAKAGLGADPAGMGPRAQDDCSDDRADAQQLEQVGAPGAHTGADLPLVLGRLGLQVDDAPGQPPQGHRGDPREGVGVAHSRAVGMAVPLTAFQTGSTLCANSTQPRAADLALNFRRVRWTRDGPPRRDSGASIDAPDQHFCGGGDGIRTHGLSIANGKRWKRANAHGLKVLVRALPDRRGHARMRADVG